MDSDDPIVVDTARSATLQQVMEQLADERLIYVGETHTAYEDHLIQLDVLRAMAKNPQGLALGVEWFQTRFQTVLDDYLAGRISESSFLRDVEYFQRWRFDYRLYRPIIQFAKDHGIPIIALNAPRELTDQIRKLGVNGLPEEFSRQLPGDYDFSDKAYEAALREVFEQHQSDDKEFQRFLEVQLTWDETMASGVAAYLQANPNGRILVLAGRGHIGGRSGIPNRVTRRTGIKGKTIASYSRTPGGPFAAADYLVLASEKSLPPAGLMRVMLDERDGGVYVSGFTQGSPAEEAGVEKGDQITAIGDAEIKNYTDVKLEMIDKKPGDPVVVTVKRESLVLGERTVKARFDLTGPTMRAH